MITVCGKELDTHEIAWAAGFFDGEGWTSLVVQNRKFGGKTRSLCVGVSQHLNNRYVVDRFNASIGGLGKIYEYEKFNLKCSNFHHVQFVLALLWKYLSPAKKQQARAVLIRYLAVKPRAGRQRPWVKIDKDAYWRRKMMESSEEE